MVNAALPEPGPLWFRNPAYRCTGAAKASGIWTTSASIENLQQTQSFAFSAICARRENRRFI